MSIWLPATSPSAASTPCCPSRTPLPAGAHRRPGQVGAGRRRGFGDERHRHRPTYTGSLRFRVDMQDQTKGNRVSNLEIPTAAARGSPSTQPPATSSSPTTSPPKAATSDTFKTIPAAQRKTHLPGLRRFLPAIRAQQGALTKPAAAGEPVVHRDAVMGGAGRIVSGEGPPDPAAAVGPASRTTADCAVHL